MADVIKRPTHEEYIRGMQEYINKLRTMDREEAKKISKETLIKTGFLMKTEMQKKILSQANSLAGKR